MKVFIVFGTRPEAIKMCPLVLELNRHKDFFDIVVCSTGQHMEMLYQVLNDFNVSLDYDLKVMQHNQSLSMLTATILSSLDKILSEESPDIVLVHGDTTTALAASLASFYKKIPIAHVEAGLRTNNLFSPFPEELNRRIIDQLSCIKFAPTMNSADNLIKGGMVNNVYVTGNTVIDAFKYTIRNPYTFLCNDLNRLDFLKKKVIVVTAHRRENWGLPLKNICKAIKQLAKQYKENIVFVYPVHLNPVVRDIVFGILDNVDNVKLIDPLSVLDMHNLLHSSYAILTDSGGLQEEALFLAKPVLLLRNETERVEGVLQGSIRVVGTNFDSIVSNVNAIINNRKVYDSMINCDNTYSYGDGTASERIVSLLRDFYTNQKRFE